jgi:hypothetical protein
MNVAKLTKPHIEKYRHLQVFDGLEKFVTKLLVHSRQKINQCQSNKPEEKAKSPYCA